MPPGGFRLPTDRELAQFALTNGATGIRETKYPELILSTPVFDEIRQMAKEGYFNVNRYNKNDTSHVSFYINSTGYSPIAKSTVQPEAWYKAMGQYSLDVWLYSDLPKPGITNPNENHRATFRFYNAKFDGLSVIARRNVVCVDGRSSQLN